MPAISRFGKSIEKGIRLSNGVWERSGIWQLYLHRFFAGSFINYTVKILYVYCNVRCLKTNKQLLKRDIYMIESERCLQLNVTEGRHAFRVCVCDLTMPASFKLCVCVVVMVILWAYISGVMGQGKVRDS